MGELRDRMATDLRLRGLSAITQRMYLNCVRRLAAYWRRSPAELGDAEVRAFLDHLVHTGPRSFSAGALRLLSLYDWPGNVRELHNAVQRAMVACDGPVVLPCHVSLATGEPGGAPSNAPFRSAPRRRHRCLRTTLRRGAPQQARRQHHPCRAGSAEGPARVRTAGQEARHRSASVLTGRTGGARHRVGEHAKRP